MPITQTFVRRVAGVEIEREAVTSEAGMPCPPGWEPAGDGQGVPPASVTNFQARAVLLSMRSPTGTPGRTLFADVNAMLHAQGGVALQAWEYANEVDRYGPLVMSLGAQLGMSDAQMDALFVTVSGITA